MSPALYWWAMSIAKALVGFLLSASLLGCAQITVISDYDATASFAELETYGWMPNQPRPGDPRLDNALFDRRVRNAVEKELATKGYRKESTRPDFQVLYHATLEEKVDVTTIYPNYPAGSNEKTKPQRATTRRPD